MNKKRKPPVSGKKQAAKNNRKIVSYCPQDNNSAHTCQDVSSSTQRLQILDFLRRNGSLTTLQARQELGICHPGMRICELRKLGLNIDTVWMNDIDSCGIVHRVANYILSGKRGGKA